MASGGYPGKYAKGKVISGLEKAAATGAIIFHCGTAFEGADIATNGGRVLSVTGLGKDLRTAVDAAYMGVNKISFKGEFHRADIAYRAFERE